MTCGHPYVVMLTEAFIYVHQFRRYTAPEYYGNRRLKSSMTKGESLMKKDVYGFGVTLLDILSSMCISEAARRQPSLEWVSYCCQQQQKMSGKLQNQFDLVLH